VNLLVSGLLEGILGGCYNSNPEKVGFKTILFFNFGTTLWKNYGAFKIRWICYDNSSPMNYSPVCWIYAPLTAASVGSKKRWFCWTIIIFLGGYISGIFVFVREITVFQLNKSWWAVIFFIDGTKRKYHMRFTQECKWQVGQVGNCLLSFWQNIRCRWVAECCIKVCIIPLDHICFEKSSSTFWQVHCCAHRIRHSCQKHDKDFFKFCGLLRKPKLYYLPTQF
jgi:hypothetical protein